MKKINAILNSNVFKNIFFYGAFFVARIPIWFVLLAVFYNFFITPAAGLYTILGILVCRGYIEAEISEGGVLTLSAMQIIRVFLKIVTLILLYLALVYFTAAAGPADQIIIASALILAVIIFFDTGAAKRYGKFTIYFRGYSLPAGYTVLAALFWLYLAFVPDSLIGDISVLIGIYLIEFYNLFKHYNLPAYAAC